MARKATVITNAAFTVLYIHRKDIISFTIATFGMSCHLVDNKNKKFSGISEMQHRLVACGFYLLISAPTSFGLNSLPFSGSS